jgi:transposase-like protein
MSNLDSAKLQKLAKELAKSVKAQEDLSNLSSMLVKMTVEAALGVEMEGHIGYR